MQTTLDRVRPGDTIVAINGHPVASRAVTTSLGEVAPGVAGVRTAPPRRPSGIEWVLYPRGVRQVTVERRRSFKTAAAAAKAWGNALGMTNVGGSLYWSADRAPQRAAAYGLRVRPTGRGLLVTGYSADAGHTKGWEALAPYLVRRGIIERDSDGQFVLISEV